MPRRFWTALAAILLLTSIGPVAARATGIEVRNPGPAGFVGLAQQGPLDEPTLVTSYEEFAALFGASTAGLANPYLAPSVAGFFFNGGERLFVVRVATADIADLIGVDGGQPGARTGLQALLDIDEIGAVAIPGETAPAVQAALIAHAEGSGDRMAILDPESTDDVDAVIVQRGNLYAPEGHAAFYFPWVVAAPTGESLTLPPSGFVAGIYARTDPPDSPFGNVVTATDVTYDLTTPEQDVINPLGINAIRNFPGNGVLVWGARTLAENPDYRFVAVRRLALVLHESIHEGTEWALDEPNDATLWAELRACVEEFMFARWTDGWFQGASPEDAFFVRCDQSTMTPQDIAEGRTIMLVGFAAQMPAEFLVLTIVHQRPDVTAAPTPASAGLRLPPARPNPFNPLTSLSFELPRAASVNLAVYDLTGRRVRAIVAGDHLEAGAHQRRWDGRDATGKAVAAGVYLVRLDDGETTRTRRVTLVR